MRAVCLCLDFDCDACTQPVHVKLKCEGPGLLREDPRATIQLECPWCDGVNEVDFDTTGTVHRVAGCRPNRLLPEPSLN